MSRVLRLPDHGSLIVCTDLQGCLRDFKSIARVFETALEETDGDAHLLFTGDLIHGPHIEEGDWPDFLGHFYRDQSGEVIEAFVDLRERHEGRVHALLGNHEHGHVGGPHTAKFAMDEVALLEQQLGPERARWFCDVLAAFPLICITPCGAVFTHGAPAANIESLREIEDAELDLSSITSPVDILDVPVVGPILWARSTAPDKARRFLRAVGGSVSIYGHDVIPEGYETIGDEQIIVSTSFGVYDHNKMYLRLNLAGEYQSVREFRVGHELLPLYPGAEEPAKSRAATTPATTPDATTT